MFECIAVKDANTRSRNVAYTTNCLRLCTSYRLATVLFQYNSLLSSYIVGMRYPFHSSSYGAYQRGQLIVYDVSLNTVLMLRTLHAAVRFVRKLVQTRDGVSCPFAYRLARYTVLPEASHCVCVRPELRFKTPGVLRLAVAANGSEALLYDQINLPYASYLVCVSPSPMSASTRFTHATSYVCLEG